MRHLQSVVGPVKKVRQGFVCAQVLVNYDDLLAAQSRGDLTIPNSRALIDIFDQDTVPVLCASAVVYYLFVQFLGYLKCGDIDRDYDDGEALLSGWELSQLEAAERYDTITNRLKTFANVRGKTSPLCEQTPSVHHLHVGPQQYLHSSQRQLHQWSKALRSFSKTTMIVAVSPPRP